MIEEWGEGDINNQCQIYVEFWFLLKIRYIVGGGGRVKVSQMNCLLTRQKSEEHRKQLDIQHLGFFCFLWVTLFFFGRLFTKLMPFICPGCGYKVG